MKPYFNFSLMEKKHYILFLSIILSLSSGVLVAQNHGTENSEKWEFIRSFYETYPVNELIRNESQCEFSLLFDQYSEAGELDKDLLQENFQNIINDLKTTGQLNTSYRLYSPFDAEHEHNLIRERASQLDFIYIPQSEDDHSNGDGSNFTRSTDCVNADFESADFGDWELYWANNGGPANLALGINDGGLNSTTGQHAIMGPGAGMDPNTGNNVPRVYPGGGAYSLRLGDEGTGWRAAKATYTFLVTPQTELFYYHYAVVLQDQGHSPAEQPFLEIRMTIDGLDESCGYYYQAAAAGASGYETYNPGGIFGTPVRYKNWTTVSINMSPYMGQVATVEFITSDCAQSGHYGYAYIDAECSALPTVDNSVLTCPEPVQTLSAPQGASSYLWSGPGIVGPSDQQTVDVNLPGTYQVQVIPVSGAICGYTLDIDVTENIGEVIAVLDAEPTQVCQGLAIDFSSQGSTSDANAGPITSYSWDFGDGNTSSDANPSHTYTTPGNYTVELTLGSQTNCQDVVTQNITIFPFPTADFTADAVCQGTVTSFQDQSTIDLNYGDVINSWTWDFGDGNTGTGQNPTHTYMNEGIYDVTLTIGTTSGCTDVVTIPVEVYPNPVPQFVSTSECEGTQNEFTDQSTVSNQYTTNQIVNWSWAFGDGNSATGQTPTNTYPNEGVYAAELTVTTDRGCTASITNDVLVYPNPVVSFLPTEVCLGIPTQFTDETTLNNSNTQNQIIGWDWDFGDGVTSNVQNPQHTYLTEGIYNVELTITTDNGCIITEVIPVTVFPNPVADFIVDDVCLNTTSVFTDLSTVNPTNGDAIVTWTWDFGNGVSSGSPTPTHTYVNENVYQVTLTVKTNNGCVDSKIKPTKVFPNPVPNFTPTEVCFGEVTEFTDLSTVSNANTNNNIISWEWDFDNGDISNAQNPSYNYPQDGLYDVELTVTTDNNCSTSTIIPVWVFPLPEASFTGIDLEGCSPVCPTVTSTSVVNSPGQIVNYEWILSNGLTYQGASPSFTDCYQTTTSDDITYDVTLHITTNHGCTAEHTETNFISVYHNPVANFYMDPDETDVTDPVIGFYNHSMYADYYEWDIDFYGQSSIFEPGEITFPSEPDRYEAQLIAYTNYGCTDTMRHVVEVLDNVIFYVPNTFTPDNDDYNEVFLPIFTHGIDLERGYTLLIFNRWGELIFESHDTQVGWNGTYGVNSSRIVKEGTYIWKITFKETMSDKHHTYVGHVNLLR